MRYYGAFLGFDGGTKNEAWFRKQYSWTEEDSKRGIIASAKDWGTCFPFSTKGLDPRHTQPIPGGWATSPHHMMGLCWWQALARAAPGPEAIFFTNTEVHWPLDNVWESTEFPELSQNPKVERIWMIDPRPGPSYNQWTLYWSKEGKEYTDSQGKEASAETLRREDCACWLYTI